MRMCTDDRAPSTSAKIRGKKLLPSTHGSIVAAVDQAKSKCGVVRSRRVARGERLGRRLGTRRGHGACRGRPARTLRDPEHLPEDEDEEEREHEEDDASAVRARPPGGVRATAAPGSRRSETARTTATAASTTDAASTSSRP